MQWTSKQHFPKDAQTFLVRLVDDAIKARKENNVVRNDLIQGFVDIQKQQRNGKF